MLVVAGVHLERLADRQQRLHPAFLEDEADPAAPVAAGARRVLAEDLDLAGIALQVALEDGDRGRLTGPVRAEEGEDLAARDVEVDAAQRLEVPVGLPQPPDADHSFRHGRGL